MMTVSDMVTAVLDVSGVERCAALFNRTLRTDLRGLPPLSIEIMWVGDADDVEVARTIWEHTIHGVMNCGTSTTEIDLPFGIRTHVGHTRLDGLAFSARLDRLGTVDDRGNSPDAVEVARTMTTKVQGKIQAIGDIEYADGDKVRGVLVELHFDEVRKLATAGLLYKDVRVTFDAPDGAA